MVQTGQDVTLLNAELLNYNKLMIDVKMAFSPKLIADDTIRQPYQMNRRHEARIFAHGPGLLVSYQIRALRLEQQHHARLLEKSNVVQLHSYHPSAHKK